MKLLQNFTLIIISIIFSVSILFAQERIDVIHLNNGDVLKGIIIENVPMDYVRIELQGGSILTYKYSQIKKFTKEIAIQNKPSASKENSNSGSPTIIVQQQQQQQEEQQIAPIPIVSQQKVTGYTDTQKMMLYEDQKKSPATAGVLSFLLSSAGHAYAGNWGRGLAFLGLRVLCVLSISAGQSDPNASEWNSDAREGNKAAVTGGIIGLIGFSIWEIFDAASETRKYNSRLYNRIYNNVPDFGFNVVPIRDGVQLSLTYNF